MEVHKLSYPWKEEDWKTPKLLLSTVRAIWRSLVHFYQTKIMLIELRFMIKELVLLKVGDIKFYEGLILDDLEEKQELNSLSINVIEKLENQKKSIKTVSLRSFSPSDNHLRKKQKSSCYTKYLLFDRKASCSLEKCSLHDVSRCCFSYFFAKYKKTKRNS